MKINLFFILVLSLLLINCSKEKKTNKLISKSWMFSEIPQKNTNNFAGYLENRSVFDGTETITFKSDNTFFVNNIEYGVWVREKNESFITITQTAYQEYSCPDGMGQTIMGWEIEKLSEDELIVNHA